MKIRSWLALVLTASFTLTACDPIDTEASPPEETTASLEGRHPGRACGTPAPLLADLLRDAALAKTRPTISQKSTAIPVEVVFHVITSGSNGAVTDAQIANQVAVLNDAYAPDFVFSLRETKRYNNKNWFTFKSESKLKKDTRVGGPNVLNVWTGDAGQYLGWATFPSNYAGSPGTDGVIIDYRTLPGGAMVYTSGGITYRYNQGDTLTHEAGHWLGLFHTFQGGCTAPGDSVADTPAERVADYDCTVGRDTCAGGGIDPVTNFMDYSDDVCLDHFTVGQATRMRDQWALYRQR